MRVSDWSKQLLFWPALRRNRGRLEVGYTHVPLLFHHFIHSLYCIITENDFYNASDAEMIGLILSNASYYNGAGILVEWHQSHDCHRVRQ